MLQAGTLVDLNKRQARHHPCLAEYPLDCEGQGFRPVDETAEHASAALFTHVKQHLTRRAGPVQAAREEVNAEIEFFYGHAGVEARAGVEAFVF